MKNAKANLLVSSCLVTAVALSGLTTAAAQDAAEAEEDEMMVRDTVMVTTTRREENLQDIAVAVTAITEETIEAIKPRNLADLTGLAPNTFIGQTTAVPGGGAIYIRGQGYADVEKTQNPAAGVIVDGVFLGTNTGQLVDAFDIQQVDVNRGPQGIFFGKNTTAGAINVIRTAPTRDFGLRTSVAYGSHNEVIVKGVANAPLGEDGGFKLGGTYRRTDGFTEDLLLGDTVDGFDYFGITAVLDYDLAPWANVELGIDYIDHSGGGTPVQYGNAFTVASFQSLFGVDFSLIPGFNAETGSPAGLGPREIFNDFPDSDELETLIYRGILTIDTPIGELTSVTAYVDSEDLVNQDFDGTCSTLVACPPTAVNALLASPTNPAGVLHTVRDQTYEQFTQEVRLAGEQGPFDYLLGVYYFDAQTMLDQTTNAAVFQLSGEDNDSIAVFGNVDWNILDTLTISGGFRYIDESRDFFTGYDVEVAPGVLFPLIPQFTDSVEFDDVITRFAIDWQPAPDHLFYLSRSGGFRSGGLSIRGTLSEQVEGQPNCLPDDGDGIPGEILCPENNFLAYEPETVTAWEFGTKNTFLDGQLILNAAYFMTDVDNFQVNDVVVTPGFGPGTNTYINNFPKVEIDGFELEAVISPAFLEGFTLTGVLGIQDGDITDGVVDGTRVGIGPGATAGAPGSISDRTGTPLIRVADFNYAIRGLYQTEVGPGDLILSLGWNFIDDHGLAGGFGSQDIEPGYGLLDASVAYEWDNYRLSFSGRNLNDKDYRINSLPTVFFQRFADDFNWLVELQAEF
ncbi:MAG: TonB-dependent receptor [Pseudomonadota bacterium]